MMIAVQCLLYNYGNNRDTRFLTPHCFMTRIALFFSLSLGALPATLHFVIFFALSSRKDKTLQ